MKSNKVGKIIGVSDLNVKVLLGNEPIKINDILFYKDEQDKIHRFEVVEIDSNIARAIPFENVQGVKKGIELELMQGGLQIEYSDKILGKMFNSYGETIDGTKIKTPKLRNVYDKKLSIKEIDINGDILWTGIKVIDFFAPLQKGYKMGLLGRSWSWKNSFNKRINK